MKFIIFLLGSALFLVMEVEVFEIVIPDFTPKKCKNIYKNCKCPNATFKSYCIIVEPYGVENPVCFLNSSNINIILSCIKFSSSSLDSSDSNFSSDYSSSSKTSEEDSKSDYEDSSSSDSDDFLVITAVVNGKKSNDSTEDREERN